MVGSRDTTPGCRFNSCRNRLLGITRDGFHSAVKLLSPWRSRAGHLAHSLLSTLVGCEQDGKHVEDLSSVVPFVDLYPWPGMGRSEQAVKQLTTYLKIAQPCVLWTLGMEGAKRARSNFLHDLGLSEKEYLDSIGTPGLVSYADPEWVADEATEEPHPETWCIHVPLYHWPRQAWHPARHRPPNDVPLLGSRDG